MQSSVLDWIWYSLMHTIFSFFVALAVLALLYYGWQNVKTRYKRWRGERAAPPTKQANVKLVSNNAVAIGDPSVAAAAMMLAVAGEVGMVTTDKEARIAELLETYIGLSPDDAARCLQRARRLETAASGDVAARLHRLAGPIEQACTPDEKSDLLEMLREVAGPSGEERPEVHDAISSLAAKLSHH